MKIRNLANGITGYRFCIYYSWVSSTNRVVEATMKTCLRHHVFTVKVIIDWCFRVCMAHRIDMGVKKAKMFKFSHFTSCIGHPSITIPIWTRYPLCISFLSVLVLRAPTRNHPQNRLYHWSVRPLCPFRSYFSHQCVALGRFWWSFLNSMINIAHPTFIPFQSDYYQLYSWIPLNLNILSPP